MSNATQHALLEACAASEAKVMQPAAQQRAAAAALHAAIKGSFYSVTCSSAERRHCGRIPAGSIALVTKFIDIS